MSDPLSPVLFEIVDAVATITLNRPQRLNAIDSELIQGLHDRIEFAMGADEVRVIILTGAGRAFCSGDDLQAPRSNDAQEVRRQVEQVQNITRLIVFGSKPVIAAVNGWAVGGGFEWVLNCDFSIWSDTAKAFMPEISIGLGVTGAATSILPQIVGWPRARAMMLLGDHLNAAEMFDLGVAHEVATPELLMVRAHLLADRIVKLPTSAVAGLKHILSIVQRGDIEAALIAEAELLVIRMSDEESSRRLAEFWNGQ